LKDQRFAEQPAKQGSVQNSAAGQVPSVSRAAENNPPHAPDRSVVYLFDDLHITFGDFSVVRKAAQRALADPSTPNTRFAISTTSGRVVLDFTDDRTKQAQTLSRIKPISLSPSAHPTCPPETSYYPRRPDHQRGGHPCSSTHEVVSWFGFEFAFQVEA
jgi:hypothetical protein